MILAICAIWLPSDVLGNTVVKEAPSASALFSTPAWLTPLEPMAFDACTSVKPLSKLIGVLPSAVNARLAEAWRLAETLQAQSLAGRHGSGVGLGCQANDQRVAAHRNNGRETGGVAAFHGVHQTPAPTSAGRSLAPCDGRSSGLLIQMREQV